MYMSTITSALALLPESPSSAKIGRRTSCRHPVTEQTPGRIGTEDRLAYLRASCGVKSLSAKSPSLKPLDGVRCNLGSFKRDGPWFKVAYSGGQGVKFPYNR